MISQHEYTVLLNLIADDMTLVGVYAFLEKTLREDSNYKQSDRVLSRRLIAYLDSLNEQEREGVIRDAHQLMQSSQK